MYTSFLLVMLFPRESVLSFKRTGTTLSFLPDPRVPYSIPRTITTTVYMSDLLRVRSIQMSSPGLVSFEGLGEVVREVREFVKDIWYRNSLERKERQLRLVLTMQHLDAARTSALRSAKEETPTDSSKMRFMGTRDLASKVNDSIEFVRELEIDGKIIDPPDHLDDLPGRGP